jgi:hypothetical protein
MAEQVELCSRCGRSRADAPGAEALAWMCDKSAGRVTWLCPTCARKHVRDIESKLPEEYW